MSKHILLKVLVTTVIFIRVLSGAAQAQHAKNEDGNQTCPHTRGWIPAADKLEQILVEHKAWLDQWKAASLSSEWLSQNPQGRANLCNAFLFGVKLTKAELAGAELNGVNLANAELSDASLYLAELNNAILVQAKLNNANLHSAKLNRAKLTKAELNNTDLSEVELNNANLVQAELNNARLYLVELNNGDLSRAKLRNSNLSSSRLGNSNLSNADLEHANLSGTELNNANLHRAKLSNAILFRAKLNNAILYEVDLNNSNLIGAELNNANLGEAELKDAQLANANLTNAIYAPASPPPNPYVAGLKGLETVSFPAVGPGQEIGLIQLRDLLQKAGLREEERKATYAIESGKTRHALAAWRDSWRGAAESLFRLVAFDWTTAYGLYPSRALTLLVVIWTLLIPAYWWTIRDHLLWSSGPSGIYRIWPKDRIAVHEGIPTLEGSAKIERLRGSDLAALGWSAWFSLLSAFHIGFREFSVGTWLSRVHPRQFTLEATGWVRTLSGLQSLISLYLLAMWVLTYFGRPFQ